MIINGNSLHIPLADNSVQCCVTSPPYFGLRDYGVDGQLGLEQTPDEYVGNMVQVFREVWRVLKDDGVLWLNLGDSYAGSGKGPSSGLNGAHHNLSETRPPIVPNGLKPKDLIGVPWRVAFALQADGWYLRSDVIWSKPNPMPESVTDRPTRAHEYIFLMSKSERYYYDHEAIKETSKPESLARMMRGVSETHKNVNGAPGQTPHSMNQPRPNRNDKQRGHSRRHAGFNERWDLMTKAEQAENGRNKRSVWTVATHPYEGAHFATFPPKLIEPCILAGSRVGDIVLDCFNGSGTTGEVAMEHNRRYVGIELNPAYIQLTQERLDYVQPRLMLEAA